ncbi:MAG: ABC transporter ATP-binding protein [Candidatus Obscuribacterales bacterium]|nr:ABC transporter ATP-binding protein [Candidatus Obscuribacterales bacterium]
MHIRIENLSKQYEEHHVKALNELNLSFEKGEFVAIMGPSGCGKSTLLNIIAGIDRQSSGRIFIGEHELSAMSENALTEMRRDNIGFIFQFFNLLSTLTVYENVALPLELAAKCGAAEIKKRAMEMLEKVSLAARHDFYPSQLSGGEMQRVAIARALVNNPQLIVADEPTGNLDTENGEQVLELFRKLCREGMHTAIMATHSQEAANCADRIVRMKDGRILESSIK